jgi:hypothetical protein
MNTLIEAAFLAAVSSLPGLSGIQYLSGVSAEESTVEGSAIIVHCPDCEHTVGPFGRRRSISDWKLPPLMATKPPTTGGLILCGNGWISLWLLVRRLGRAG